jgi:hypothetical protein
MNYATRLLFAVLTLTALMFHSAHAQTPTFNRAIACTSNAEGFDWGPQHVAVDGQGNTLVTGQFNGTVALGSAVLTATGTSTGFPNPAPPDVFVAKLDAAGNYAWAAQTSGTQWEYVSSLAVDAAGDVYVCGRFESYSVSFGPGITLYNSSSASEAYVAKLSGTTGQWLWARRCGGLGNDNGVSLAINPQGDICFAGYMAGGITDYGPYTLPANGRAYLFVAKLNAAGTWLWARQTATGGYPTLSGMVLDGQNNIYLAGSFDTRGGTGSTAGGGTLTIGATTLTAFTPAAPPLYPSTAGSDVFVAKLTDAGTWLWAIQGEPSGNNIASISALALDGMGHLFLTGRYGWQSARFGSSVLLNQSTATQGPQAPTGQVTYGTDVYVARLNATTGAWEWVSRAGGSQNDVTTAITADGQGRVYIASGNYGSFVGLDSPLPGGGRVHLAQLDGATGTWRWALPLPSAPPQHLALDAASRLAVVGFFSGTSASFGNTTLVQQGGTSGTTGYVARLGAGPLATRPTTARPDALQVWPNPSAGGTMQVQGPAPGQTVQVLDALGRVVATGRMPAQGVLSLALPPTAAAGLYVVRSAGQVRQLVVE